MKKSLLSTLMALTMLLTMFMTGCGEILVERNVISEEEFWIGIEEHGYTKEFDMSKEFIESNGFDDSEMITKAAYFNEYPVEYLFVETKSNSRALQVFNSFVDGYESVCNSNTSVTSGSYKSWNGSNKADDIFISVQKYENIIIVGCDTYENKEKVQNIIEQLFTMDFSGKELKYEPTPTPEPTATPTPEPVPEIGESSGSHVVYVSDVPIYISNVEGWVFDDSYNNILPVKAGNCEVIYSDSFIDVGDERNVANTLVEQYDIPEENVQAITLNDEKAYMGFTYNEEYASVVVYQNIGLQTYLELEIDYGGKIETTDDLLQIISKFALNVK